MKGEGAMNDPRPPRRDFWRDFDAPSKPIAVEGGLASSKRRGTMADSWWSQRCVHVLESYGLGPRMERGRRYARAGQVVSLDVAPGHIAAVVQGSRSTPYTVAVGFMVPRRPQWAKVEARLAGAVAIVAHLLDGDMPPELEDVFADAGVPLFPSTWSAMTARCSCPDDANPCKHIAAVLYVFADQLDRDPWLLLQWRGRSRDELLAPLRAAGAGASSIRADAVAPWWPFAPDAFAQRAVPLGRALNIDGPGVAFGDVEVEPVAHVGAVLETLAALDMPTGKLDVASALVAAYQRLSEPTE